MQEPLKIPNEAQVTVLACLIVIIVMANTVVIRVILVRKLMNITSMFIIAISVSNILIGPVMISLEVSRLLADASLSAMGCHFIVYFEMTCFTANMYTLMVFIVDMYRTIIVKYRRTYSRIRVVVAILLVWAASFIFATKSFVHLNNGDTSCSHRDQSAGKENGTHGYVNNTRACEEGDDKNDDSDDISENIMCSYLMEESEGDIVSRYVDLVVILIIPQAVCTVCMVKMRYRLWSHELGLNRTLRQRRKLVKLLVGNYHLWFFFLNLLLSVFIFFLHSLPTDKDRSNKWVDFLSASNWWSFFFFFGVSILCRLLST